MGERDKIVLGTGLKRVSPTTTTTTTEQQGDKDKDSDHPNDWSHTTTKVYATLSGCLQYTCRSTGSSSSSRSGGGGGTTTTRKHVYWIRSSNSARGLQPQDRVVGIVQERIGPDGNGGEYYRIHLGSHAAIPGTAILSNLSFEGATKRNKPSLDVGQVLYTRIAESASYLAEPILSCQLGPHDTASSLQPKDWMTNEGIYGLLQGGTVFPVSPGLARVLLTPQANGIWDAVTKHSLTNTFEIAIGVNGLVWLHAAPSPQATIVLQNVMINSQLLTPEQTAAMVKQLVYTMQKQMQKQQDQQEQQT